MNSKDNGMVGTTELERRIKEKIAASEERRRLRQFYLQTLMRQTTERVALYTAAADRLMHEVIRPRLATVMAHLRRIATLELEDTRHSCCLRLAHTPRFPSTTRLEVGVTRDSNAQNLIVQYRLSILAVFFRFDDGSDIKFAVDRVDTGAVGRWLDDRLVDFVDNYLRLETHACYQDENRVTDPVCGMCVNRADVPAQAEHEGKTYYFCVAECRDRFLADPGRYVRPSARSAPVASLLQLPAAAVLHATG